MSAEAKEFIPGPNCEYPGYCPNIDNCWRAVLVDNELINARRGWENDLRRLVSDATCKNKIVKDKIAEAQIQLDKK